MGSPRKKESDLNNNAQFAATRLTELLRAAANGHFPAADGGVTVLPQPSARDAGVLGFTAHAVVFADVNPEWVTAQLPPGDLAAPLAAPFLPPLPAPPNPPPSALH